MKKVWLSLFAFGLISCDSDIEDNEIYGTYILEFTKTKSEIEILSDGKYRHLVKVDGDTVFNEVQVWRFDNFTGERGITFHDFKEVGNNAIREKGAYWFVVPSKDWQGNLLLCGALDEDGCYKKVGSKI